MLRAVDASFARGQSIALLGRSGSGKSSLLNLCAGIDVPDAGTVTVLGQDLNGMADRERTLFRRRSIGFVFQSFHLLPLLSAAENVRLPLELDGRNATPGAARTAELLQRVGLGDRGDSRPDRMSGGEQQRVAIARALAMDPPLLLADEPTGNLDGENAERILEILIALAREDRCVVIATHSRRIADACDRVLRLENGELLETPEADRAPPTATG